MLKTDELSKFFIECDNDIYWRNAVKLMLPLASVGYVVTRYHKHAPYEVVPVIVVKKTYSITKDTKYFSVVGKWKNGNNYKASFTPNSINRTFFIHQVDAEITARKLNDKESK